MFSDIIVFVVAVDKFATTEIKDGFKRSFASVLELFLLEDSEFVLFTPPKETPSMAPLEGYTWVYLPQLTVKGEHVSYILTTYSEGYVLFYFSPHIR